MPVNLNALIRYRAIDKSLRNRSYDSTLRRLQEDVSDALGEYRGRYKLVSPRTIYDDLRVMKSDMLGFNAPIDQENGIYVYRDDDYALFNSTESYTKLLEDIIKFLVSKKTYLPGKETDELIDRIAEILGLPSNKNKDYKSSKSIIISEEYLTKAFKEIQNERKDMSEYIFLLDYISNKIKKTIK